VARKYPALDLIHLKLNRKQEDWNLVLTDCALNHDVEKLKAIRYGLQAGMDDLVKSKLNDDKMAEFFIRLQRSVENTMRQILREKFPNPHDNPLLKEFFDGALAAKRARDHAFELWLRESAY
jgi:hypothetical protein